MAQKIVTCKKCGFQTTWVAVVDWDDEFQCGNCSGTKYGRFTNRAVSIPAEKRIADSDFVQFGTFTSRFNCKEPNISAKPSHESHTFYPGNADGSCTYCDRLNPDGKNCLRDGKAVLIYRAKEKKELLDKVREFLWKYEHIDSEFIFPKESIRDMEELMCESHELRVEFDRVFGEQTGEGK